MNVKNLTILVFVLFILFSCKKEEFTINNLNGNKISAFGHAGMGQNPAYPLNSYESILKCLNLGMNGSELDVQMTKDSVLVAYHDIDLSDNMNFAGFVNSYTWDELKDAHYTKTPYLNYSIVSLDHLFSNIENLQDNKFTFDCKFNTNNTNTNQYFETFINAILRLAEQHNLDDNIYIESHHEEFLKLFQIKRPDYKLFFLHTDFDYAFDRVSSLGFFGISLPFYEMTSEQINTAHENNFFVTVWDVRSKSENEDAIRKNPDFIQTDKPKHLLKLLK